MNITSVVIIYNSQLRESDTLNSLLRCKLENVNLNVCIWNNGPSLLTEDDAANFIWQCQEKGIRAKIYQDIRNLALSKIYNFFIKENQYDMITILDQDSQLPQDFLTNISSHHLADIIVPKIFVKNQDDEYVQIYPHEYKKYDNKIKYGNIENKIDSAMSGVTLSAKFIEKIKTFRGAVFEEKLAFYGIDSDLFREINKMIDKGADLKLHCIGSINHSFSYLSPIKEENEFRDAEIFYFKYFIRMEYQKKSKLSTLWVCIRDFVRTKSNLNKTKKMIPFIFAGIHPRSKLEIPEGLQPTHSLIYLERN
ncbi:glycosyltransferase family 2 protein [Pectobacterium cacticida]|uniref:glycosyltransferase family 2 protein n=1 Tax=Pectobacterium cacticida TaxID=69221 RepID=UPI002FEFBB4C